MTSVVAIRKNTNHELARADFIRGAKLYSLWLTLAWVEIKQRYRRSIIGPFWITTSTGVMIASMGPLYGYLFDQDISHYVQYLAVSMIVWSFISSSINESGAIFISAESYMKQMPLPLSVYVYRHLAKSLIIFTHNLFIIPVVFLFFPVEKSPNYWLLVLGIFLLSANLFWIYFCIALLSARFRDIPLIVVNVMQAAFFITPILWRVDMLKGRGHMFMGLNPIFHLIEVVRVPLLGEPVNISSWVISFFILGSGGFLTFLLFSRYRARIVYWI